MGLSQNTMAHILRHLHISGKTDCGPSDERELRDSELWIVIANMNESGFADYPDMRRETIVVLADCPQDRFPVPFDRSQTMATTTAGIADDGTALMSLMSGCPGFRLVEKNAR
jgi:hypothetical protein